MKRRLEVLISRSAEKSLRKIPREIILALRLWIEEVRRYGIHEVRKIKGYHDEPLQGKRQGQRSVRLSRSYRLFYHRDLSGEVEIIEIVEVNKHDY